MEDTQRLARQELREFIDLKFQQLSERITKGFARSLQWNVVLWLTTLAAIGALKFTR